ncbi:MAG: hypothetical protein JXR84_06445 [Anaerolineae bacterium]|nr:hypothetical protein [Anaerolineae bacterium]
MTDDEFLELVAHFCERALPAQVGRHVYLWHGKIAPLTLRLSGTVVQTLNLHELAAGLSRAPRSVDAARSLLNEAIASQMSRLISPHGQQIVLVTGCDLLSRYGMRLTPFVEYVSDRVMVIFVLAPDETRFQPPVPLPSYISLEPDAPLAYLQNMIDKRAVIDNVEEVI